MNSFRSFVERIFSLSTTELLILALILRVAWIALCPNQPVSDQATYDALAHQIAEGHGYSNLDGSPANLWPVGYPALLAAAYFLFGAHAWAAFLLNIALSLFLLLGVQRLGAALFGPRTGQVSALLVALHPTLVMHTTLWTSELPFMAFSVWLFWLQLRIARNELPLPAAVLSAGLMTGLLCYVRPTAQAFLLVLPLLGVLWRKLPPSKLLLASAGIIVLALLVLLPWGLRNQRAFGVFALTSLNGGENIWMGNNPDSHGDYMELPADALAMPLVERERVLRERGLAYIRENPLRYVELCARRAFSTLRSDTIAPVWNALGLTKRFGTYGVTSFKLVCSGWHWLLLAAGIFACFTRKSFDRNDASLWLLVLPLAAPFILIVGGNRYMVPILPLLSIWAASGLARAWVRALRAAQRAPVPQPVE